MEANSYSYKTDINQLPDVILSNIIAAVSDVRSRNCAALVCRKWLHLERSTRIGLALRGNARDLHMVPSSCFQSVLHLDLSLVSPWGHPLLLLLSHADPPLISHLLATAFPNTTSLTLYSRNPSALHLLAPYWPNLSHLKLVRWHQRPQLPPGADFLPLFLYLPSLFHLDLSCFYCWPEDLYPALQAYPHVAARLTSLNLLNPSFSEGFKAQEVEDVTRVCPNLREFLVACMFDPRYLGFVGDQTLLAVAGNCPKLVRLHMMDKGALVNARADPDEGAGPTAEAARVTVTTLIEMFSGLPLLEDFALDVCNEVRDSGPAFEALRTKCPRLRRLKVGQLQGICMPVESKLDGIALCQGLESLSIRNVDDLTDFGLIAIARGCWRLAKFEVEGCKQITMRGMRTLASLLKRSLVEVKISSCKNLGAFSSLKALEPIQGRIQRLHIDCVWDAIEEFENVDGVEFNFDLNSSDDGIACDLSEEFTNNSCESEDMGYNKKKRKYNCDNHGSLVCHHVQGATSSSCGNGHTNVNGGDGSGYGFYGGTWKRLQYLSLWISVGEILNPLVKAGLQNCPNLEEIRIKVEGDCRDRSKPSHREFGLSSLDRYYKLTKMNLDCGDMIGFTHTAPFGHIDLSLWERFYLLGIQTLRLSELDYWPPQDRDVNQRSLSLPAAGLLQECITLRKLFIHGTAHEHFMKFLLNNPNLRDVQLREDYYPAPENDMSTEMRADSCSRFEDALNARNVID